MNLLFIGFQELIIIFLIVVIFFGADKIPEVARGLAKVIAQVRNATDEVKREILESTQVNEIQKDVQNEIESFTDDINKEIDDTSSEIEGTFKRDL